MTCKYRAILSKYIFRKLLSNVKIFTTSGMYVAQILHIATAHNCRTLTFAMRPNRPVAAADRSRLIYRANSFDKELAKSCIWLEIRDT